MWTKRSRNATGRLRQACRFYPPGQLLAYLVRSGHPQLIRFGPRHENGMGQPVTLPHSTFLLPIPSTPGLNTSLHKWVRAEQWLPPLLPASMVLVSSARPSHSRPAMAGGIYSANLWKCAVVGLDSRFRGNDPRLEWIPIPNDTSACLHIALDKRRRKSEYWFILYLEPLDGLDCYSTSTTLPAAAIRRDRSPGGRKSPGPRAR
jgi:hypothetical protein